MLRHLVLTFLFSNHIYAQHDHPTASKAARDVLHHMDPILRFIFEYECATNYEQHPKHVLRAALHLCDKHAQRAPHIVQQQAERYVKEHLLTPEHAEHRTLYVYGTMHPAPAQGLMRPHADSTASPRITLLYENRNHWDNGTADLRMLAIRAELWATRQLEIRLIQELHRQLDNQRRLEHQLQQQNRGNNYVMPPTADHRTHHTSACCR